MLKKAGLLATAATVFALSGCEEPPEEPETNTAPDVTYSAQDRQGILYNAAEGAARMMREQVAAEIITEAEAKQMFTEIERVVNANPESLFEAIVGDREIQPGFAGAGLMYGHRNPYNGSAAFLEQVSPRLLDVDKAVYIEDECVKAFTGNYTAEMERDGLKVLRQMNAYKPDGVSELSCADGAQVEMLHYPKDAADVSVSYNFPLQVTYFDKQGHSYGYDNEDGHSVLPFSQLENTQGLTQAFEDRAAAEAYMQKQQDLARAYFVDAFPQIMQELKAAARDGAAPAPAQNVSPTP